jgi:hypothetical protein
MASDEELRDQLDTTAGLRARVRQLERERDEARVKYNAIELSWGEQLHELKALCREAAYHWIRWVDENHDGDDEESCNCDLAKRLREAGGE